MKNFVRTRARPVDFNVVPLFMTMCVFENDFPGRRERDNFSWFLFLFWQRFCLCRTEDSVSSVYGTCTEI